MKSSQYLAALAALKEMTAQRDEARRERDEARQMVCEHRAVQAWSDEGCPRGFHRGDWQRKAALNLGWDCYRKEVHNG